MQRLLISLAVLTIAGVAVAQPGPQPRVRPEVKAARELMQQGDYTGAVVAVDAALVRYPNDPVALAVRGLSRQELGDTASALRDLDASLLLAPQSPNALVNACFARARANVDLDNAVWLCNRALEVMPFWEAYDTRGFLRLRRGDYVRAIYDYNAALKQQPKYSSSLYGRGLARLRLGREAEGRADLAAAAALQPDIAVIFARWGIPAPE